MQAVDTLTNHRRLIDDDSAFIACRHTGNELKIAPDDKSLFATLGTGHIFATAKFRFRAHMRTCVVVNESFRLVQRASATMTAGTYRRQASTFRTSQNLIHLNPANTRIGIPLLLLSNILLQSKLSEQRIVDWNYQP